MASKSIPDFTPEEIEAVKNSSSKIPDFTPEEIASVKGSSGSNDPLEQANVAARSAAEGMTFGLSEPIFSYLNARVSNLVDAGLNASEAEDFLDKAKIFLSEYKNPAALKKAYDEDVERRRELKAKYPMTDVGSEIAGAFTSPANKALTGVSKGIKAGVEAIPGAKKVLASKNLLTGGTARTALAAAQGAGIATAGEGVKRLVETPTGFIQDQDHKPSMADVAKTGAVIGGGLHAGIGSAKNIAQVAGSMGKGILASMSGVKPTIINEYLKQGEAARNAVSPEDAKAAVDDAIRMVKGNISDRRSQFTDDMLSSLERLKDKVDQMSDKSYEILDQHADEWIHIPNFKKVITQEINALKPVKKGQPIGDAAQAAVTRLEEYYGRLANYPKKIQMRQAKMLLQQLGHDMTEIKNAGGYGNPSSNAVAAIRDSLDQVVKRKVPAYDEMMEKVADETVALKRLSKRFGTPEKIAGKINRFNQTGSEIDTAGLEELQRRTVEGANEFGEPLQGQIPLFNKSQALTDNLAKIQEARKIVSLDPNQTQSFIQTIFNNSSIENKKTLQLLASMTDSQLVQLVQNAGVKDAFTKQFNAGSANINLWTALGFASASGVAGHVVGGQFGMAGGALLGSLVKFYGAPTARQILDGLSRMQGAPTLQKIDQYFSQVPEPVKNDLKMQLIRAVQMGQNSTTPVVVPQSDYQQTLIDIDGAKGLTTIDKAKAIDSLNRTGTVSSSYLGKMMTDGADKVKPVEAPQDPQTPTISLEEMTNRIRNNPQK